MEPVYLDHAATTPLDPRVLEEMMPWLTTHHGNASSVHGAGRRARHAIEDSRARVADLLGVAPASLVFTSGGTESNNFAIRGTLRSGGLVTCAAEHEAVLRPVERQAHAGRPTHVIAPDERGAVSLSELRKALAKHPVALVALMYVNNEVGTINPLQDIAAVCREHDVPWHCDAVQAVATQVVRPAALGASTLALSAHKIGGPAGVGLLFVEPGHALEPLIAGGAQERRRRGGTESVAAIVGFARALELASLDREVNADRLGALRNRLADGLVQTLAMGVHLNTPMEASAPHILNVSFPGDRVDGEMLLLGMDTEGIQVSAGSACSAGTLEPSHVLLAMGVPRETAAASLRYSLGRQTTTTDIDRAIDATWRVVQRVRAAT